MPRPVWKHTLDVSEFFHDDKLSVVEKAHKVGAMIRRQRWFSEDDFTLDEIAGAFCDMTDEDDDGQYFDDWWSSFYDWCDEARVWVTTH